MHCRPLATGRKTYGEENGTTTEPRKPPARATACIYAIFRKSTLLSGALYPPKSFLVGLEDVKDGIASHIARLQGLFGSSPGRSLYGPRVSATATGAPRGLPQFDTEASGAAQCALAGISREEYAAGTQWRAMNIGLSPRR